MKRKQIRLQTYDYSTPGYYYATICTQNRECLFGEIIDGNMVLNDYGHIVSNILHSLPYRYKQIKLNTSQIMPNHIHMIIIIVGAHHDAPQQQNHAPQQEKRQQTKRGDKRQLLPMCIGYLKMNTTKQINNLIVRAHTLGLSSSRSMMRPNDQ